VWLGGARCLSQIFARCPLGICRTPIDWTLAGERRRRVGFRSKKTDTALNVWSVCICIYIISIIIYIFIYPGIRYQMRGTNESGGWFGLGGRETVHPSAAVDS
jgi:hypothetical protein